MADNAAEMPDLETILLKISYTFLDLIDSSAEESLLNAVLSAPDVHALQLRRWLSDNFSFPEPSAVRKDYVAKAWIAFVLAKHAYEHGDLTTAWYHVSEARYQQGQIDADYVAMQRIDNIRRAGRKGGQATAMKRSRLMRHLFDLLEQERPKEGWTSYDGAWERLSLELIDYSQRDGDVLTYDDIRQQVMTWLATNPDITAAYQGSTDARRRLPTTPTI